VDLRVGLDAVVKRKKCFCVARCVTNEILAITWREIEYRRDVCRATSGAHIRNFV